MRVAIEVDSCDVVSSIVRAMSVCLVIHDKEKSKYDAAYRKHEEVLSLIKRANTFSEEGYDDLEACKVWIKDVGEIAGYLWD